MEIETYSFEIKTKGNNDLVDITNNIESQINSSDFIEGQVLVFIGGSTAGVTTIEYEPGLLQDYPKFFEKIIPSNVPYNHDKTWHDGNGYAHIRAALQGASITIPFKDKKLLLGTWQQVILVDFDNRSRNRKVIIQISGKKL